MDSESPSEAVSDESGVGECSNIFGDVDLGHFIPFRKADVIDMCVADGGLPEADGQGFRSFCEILSALFHFEYHQRLETLKDCFAPFNPDADTRCVQHLTADELRDREQRFIEMLKEVLVGANYVEMSRAELEEALNAESRFKVSLSVDLDDFEELVVFVRGKGPRPDLRKTLLGLRKKTVETIYYERVVIYIRFKGEEYFRAKRLKNVPFQPGESCLKLFKDIPVEDMQTVFPNAAIRMRTVDKLILGVPAAVGGLVVLVTKLGATLLLILGLVAFWLGISKKAVTVEQRHLVALGIGLATLGGYVFRQLSKIKNRKIQYLKSLSESLYFKVLDNNAGVFSHLTDAAEEEDNKEALLAYYFLCTRKADLTEPQLDAAIEKWFLDRHGVKLDFEVDDAMDKLERLELAWREGDVLRVKSLGDAKVRIDYIWDNYFTYNNEAEAAQKADEDAPPEGGSSS